MAIQETSSSGAGFSGTVNASENYPEVKAHCIIDSHMHIQSGACGPKPLVDYQLSRTNLGSTLLKGRMILADGLILQGKDCDEIGVRIARDMTGTYKETVENSAFAVQPSPAEHREGTQQSQPITPLFSSVVIMPMDMEYAHLAGYPDNNGNASTIYHHENNESFYWKRKSATAPEDKGEKQNISEKKWKNFKKWKKQFDETKKSVLAYPWQQFFLYHYDPRRWRLKEQTTPDEFWNSGTWFQPFSDVATNQHPGICLGFKMYPPLGYKPLDPKLPLLWDYTKPDKSDCFYGKCETEGIPILTHCSPGGMTTNEVDFYAELEGFDPTVAVDEPMPAATRERIQSPMWFYYNEFVHPKQWRKVLQKFPKLKLCLAHFGGREWEAAGPANNEWIREIIDLIVEKDETDPAKFKYPNVYTDVSCWNWENRDATEAFKATLRKKEYFQLRKRILFGTDWYMILIVSPFQGYEDQCKKFKKVIDELQREGNWFYERFTLLNPFEFYGLAEKDPATGEYLKLSNVYESLKGGKADPGKCCDGYERLLNICNEVNKIKEDINQWDEPEPSQE